MGGQISRQWLQGARPAGPRRARSSASSFFHTPPPRRRGELISRAIWARLIGARLLSVPIFKSALPPLDLERSWPAWRHHSSPGSRCAANEGHIAFGVVLCVPDHNPWGWRRSRSRSRRRRRSRRSDMARRMQKKCMGRCRVDSWVEEVGCCESVPPQRRWN